LIFLPQLPESWDYRCAPPYPLWACSQARPGLWHATFPASSRCSALSRLPPQGMGGQHGYFGLWVDADFGKGHSKAKPRCTTYNSPQLSAKEDFRFDKIEVWGVGDPPETQLVSAMLSYTPHEGPGTISWLHLTVCPHVCLAAAAASEGTGRCSAQLGGLVEPSWEAGTCLRCAPGWAGRPCTLPSPL
jgi:hypothetical protein